VMAVWSLWKRDWEEERHAQATMSLEERLGEQVLLMKKELDAAKAEIAVARAAGFDPADAEAAFNRQLEEQLEAEKQKRIAHTQEMAVRRIGKRDLTRGWVAWLDTYIQVQHEKRLLLSAGARLTRPKLVACMHAWREDWRTDQEKKKAMSMGQRLKAEVEQRRQLQQDMAAQLQALRAELEVARKAALEGRGLEAEMQRQLDEKLKAEKQKRIEHTKEMAIRRIGKRDLTRGWVCWLDQYQEGEREKRLLRAAGNKLTRPKLSASMQVWRDDWQCEVMRKLKAENTSVEDRLREQLFHAKTELAEARTMLMNEEGAEEAMQRQMEEKLEAEREKRIAHTQHMALMRVLKRDLARGWVGWLDMYLENQRQKSLLKKAGAKLTKPRLVSCFQSWREDWHDEEMAKRNRRLGTQLSREMRDGQRAKQELALALEELTQLRLAVAEGRGLEAENQRRLQEQLEREKEKRIEHVQFVAARRIANRALASGWSKWHGDWADGKRLNRMLKAAGGRMLRPKLVAGYQHWRRDWEEEVAEKKAMSIAEQLDAQRQQTYKAEAELRVMREELESARHAMIEGRGLEAEQKRLLEERLEEERQKRIEHTKEMAVRRVLKRELARGWMGWLEPYLELKRRQLLLQQAGSRLLKPKLAKSFQIWSKQAIDEKYAKASMGIGEKLAAATHEREELTVQLQKVQRELDDQRKLDEVALGDSRSALQEIQSKVSELHEEVAKERKAAIMARAKEEALAKAMDHQKSKVKHAEELLKEQQEQAKGHLAKQLAATRKALEDQLAGAQGTIKDLRDEVSRLQAGQWSTHGNAPAAAPRPGSGRDQKKDKRKASVRGTGILGDVDFDEDRPLGVQLKEALSKHAIRVLDLFRDWDTNGDGEISRKEFREAMPKLGMDLPADVVDALFDENDPDHSGVMDFKELQRMLRPPASTPGGAKALWGAAKEGASSGTGKAKGLAAIAALASTKA
jgi:hypothetical protein